jgi:hypothetical protein
MASHQDRYCSHIHFEFYNYNTRCLQVFCFSSGKARRLSVVHTSEVELSDIGRRAYSMRGRTERKKLQHQRVVNDIRSLIVTTCHISASTIHTASGDSRLPFASHDLTPSGACMCPHGNTWLMSLPKLDLSSTADGCHM